MQIDVGKKSYKVKEVEVTREIDGKKVVAYRVRQGKLFHSTTLLNELVKFLRGDRKI